MAAWGRHVLKVAQMTAGRGSRETREIRASVRRPGGFTVSSSILVLLLGVGMVRAEEISPSQSSVRVRLLGPVQGDGNIQVVAQSGRTMIEIRSDRGIGRLEMTRGMCAWPTSMLVRLHLGGLECFVVEREGLSVAWAVSSTGNHEAMVSLRQADNERPLDEESPYYTPVRIVGGNGRIPLQDGYFEIVLPAKLFEGNPQALTLRWVDFFRN
jgi:hypothetical protein